jgi:enoyl-[acyl-carrier-protein] reductase (NADH)
MLCLGKRAFIAGVADDNGYGWAIAKSLAEAGAEILVGTWVPVSKYYKIQCCRQNVEQITIFLLYAT